MRKYWYLLFLLIPNNIWSQASYMHEIAEEAGENTIGGLLALGILFGIIYLINKLRTHLREIEKETEKEDFKKEIAISVAESVLNNSSYISKFQQNLSWRKGYINAQYDIQNNKLRRLYDKSIDDLIDDYSKNVLEDRMQAEKLMEEIGYFEHLKYNNQILIRDGIEPFKYLVSTQKISHPLPIEMSENLIAFNEDATLREDSKNNYFINQCILIYGEYTEIVHGCLSIKEDGEYRIIKNDDLRYEPLYDYVFENYKDRICPFNPIYNYLKHNLDVFRLAKPIESYGVLEKEFYGGRIIALKAYYCKTFFAPNAISLNDYILTLGYETAMHLHKYIEIPMDYSVYYNLRIMQIQGFTLDEYKEYIRKAGQWHEEEEGWFDGWWGYIGKTYSEARENFDKKQGYTFQEALDETAKIEWHI